VPIEYCCLSWLLRIASRWFRWKGNNEWSCGSFWSDHLGLENRQRQWIFSQSSQMRVEKRRIEDLTSSRQNHPLLFSSRNNSVLSYLEARISLEWLVVRYSKYQRNARNRLRFYLALLNDSRITSSRRMSSFDSIYSLQIPVNLWRGLGVISTRWLHFHEKDNRLTDGRNITGAEGWKVFFGIFREMVAHRITCVWHCQW